MKPVLVEFKSVPRPSRMAWAFVVVMAVSSIVIWSIALHQRKLLESQRHAEEVARQQAEIERQRERLKPQPEPPWMASAREMVEQAQRPWPEVLTALETVAVAGVTPVAVDIQVPTGAVSVDVEFDDYQALFEYLTQLNAGDPPSRWSLLQTQSASKTVPGKPGGQQKSMATLRLTMVNKR